MLLRVRAPAILADDDGEMEIPKSWDFSARRLDDLELANYLDEALVDLGVSGGEVWLRRENGRWYVDIDYWCAAIPSKARLDQLLEEARGQLSDGAGECMELREADELGAVLGAGADEAELLVIDDGRSVPPPNELAILARNGETRRLEEALERGAGEDLRRRHGGRSPLAWACSNGHSDAAYILLDAGAPPRETGAARDDLDSFDPLRTCVLSRACADEAAVHIARGLVARGVVDDWGFLAEQAAARGKTRLASYLRGLS